VQKHNDACCDGLPLGHRHEAAQGPGTGCCATLLASDGRTPEHAWYDAKRVIDCSFFFLFFFSFFSFICVVWFEMHTDSVANLSEEGLFRKSGESDAIESIMARLDSGMRFDTPFCDIPFLLMALGDYEFTNLSELHSVTSMNTFFIIILLLFLLRFSVFVNSVSHR
jgi:hypothetical protein